MKPSLRVAFPFLLGLAVIFDSARLWESVWLSNLDQWKTLSPLKFFEGDAQYPCFLLFDKLSIENGTNRLSSSKNNLAFRGLWLPISTATMKSANGCRKFDYLIVCRILVFVFESLNISHMNKHRQKWVHAKTFDKNERNQHDSTLKKDIWFPPVDIVKKTVINGTHVQASRDSFNGGVFYCKNRFWKKLQYIFSNQVKRCLFWKKLK